jgi:translation initiation factor IF-2
MPYFGISAKTGENIEELFYKIAEMLEQQEMEKHRKLKQDRGRAGKSVPGLEASSTFL